MITILQVSKRNKNMKKEKIDFYVGIIPKDREKLMQMVNLLNEDTDPNFHVFIKNEFDDPDGYYNFVMNGTFKSYQCFLDECGSNKFVRSLTHYEE
jgi:hypothetical protein